MHHKESLIMWLFPSGAAISNSRSRLNTSHCQTSSHLGLQMKYPPTPQEVLPVMRTQHWDSDCLFSSRHGPIYIKTPVTTASRWAGDDLAISEEEFNSDTFWKHIECHVFTRCSNPNWLCCSSSSSASFKIHCNWLHPGGTPGSNILIKLICEILTMWVFRWLVIWCERESLFSLGRYGRSWHLFQQNVAENYRCRVILRAGNYKWQCLSFFSWNAISKPSFFLCLRLLLVMACQSIFFPILLRSWAIFSEWFPTHVINLIIIMCFWEMKKVCAPLALIQMFSCTVGKNMYVNSETSKISQQHNLFFKLCFCSFTFPVGHKWKLLFDE